jgi:hypothetical protein
MDRPGFTERLLMPVAKANTLKNGLTTLNRTAKALCRAVQFAAPAIRAQYPGNAQLMAALTAAETLCTTLVPATDEQMAQDALDDLLIPDYDDAGVRPGRLP